MVALKKKTTGKVKAITLRDVIVHMNNIEQRLSAKIGENTQGIKENTVSMHRLEGRVDVLGENLTTRMDALEEDLTAVIKDTMKIRRHVGLVNAEEL